MADKVFNIKFNVDGNVGPLKSALDGLKGSFEKLKLPDNLGKNFISTFDKLENEVKNFEAITSKGFQNMGDIGKAEKSYEKITTLFSRLQQEVAHIKGVDPNKLLPPETLERTKQLKTAWEGLLKAQQQTTNRESQIATQTQEINKQKEALDRLKQVQTELTKAQKSLPALKGNVTKADNRGLDTTAAITKLETAKQTITSLKTEAEQLFATLNLGKFTGDFTSGITQATENVKLLEKDLQSLKRQIDQIPGAKEKVRELLAEFKYNGDISKVSTDIQEIGRDISTLNSAAIEEINTRISNLSNNSTKAKTALDPIGPAIRKAADDGGALDERSRDLQRLADQAKYFFSITNSIQLFKRTVRSAFNTIKELDEVMTQAAVVTKFDVSDMWKQLPEYAKRADELGVSLKGTYEAATLYYQQGLETNQVIGVSSETLKMAKIAGMDYATATDYMTSALRGFNMEVNEASAQRVNDVYSELAARSASNTEELSIAMSKTAPLAHNAGMEIESTAAILANMIETTREAPETLGTAMKTVIARFQELKKAPDQIGEVEGEIVDANKIETALKSIGVALRDSQGQFRDFDDVIFDISAKWNTLDKNTQRYIATIAAGSRQQSRFIAMVGDYDRTMELVEMANNSAGASEAQFAKTQDSLASKLERLKTAWAEFTMGIANNQIIKAAIDGLTALIKMVNTLTNALSGGKNGSGLLKSVINTAALIAGIKGARAVLNGFFAFILKTSKTTGVAAGANIGAGITKGMTSSIGTSAAAKGTGILNSISAGFLGLQTKSNNIKRWIGKDQDYNEFVKTLDLKAGRNAMIEKGQIHASSFYYPPVPPATIASYQSLAKNIELTAEQQAVATMLTEKGVQADIAKVGAANGLTAAEAQQIITKGTDLKMTEKEIALELQAAAAEKTHAAASGKLLKTQLKNLGTGFKNLGASIITGLTSPLGIVLIALTAIAGIIATIHHFSLGEQIKRAQKATQEATESAQEAQQAYDDLLSGRENYNNLQNKLSELTYGTKEFTQALLEANAQVLDLMDKYSGLEVTTGEYGQLIIKEDSWEKAIEQQSNLAIAKQNQVFSNKIKEIDLQQKKAEKDLRNVLADRAPGQASKILSEVSWENVGAIREKYKLNEKETRAVNDYLMTTTSNAQTKSGYYQNMVTSSLSDEAKTSEYAGQISKILESRFAKERSEYVKQAGQNARNIKQVWFNPFDPLDLGSKEVKEAKEQRELIKQQYSDLTGIPISELKNTKKALEEYAAAVFEGSYEEIGDSLLKGFEQYGEQFPAIFDALAGNMTQAFREAFGDIDFEGIANPEEWFSNNFFNGDIEAFELFLRTMGFTITDEGGNIVADVEGFVEQIKGGAEDAEQAWLASQQTTIDNLQQIGYSPEAAKTQFGSIENIDDQKIVSGIFNNAYENLGVDSPIVQNIANRFPKLLKEGVSGADIQDIFGNIDFSSSAAAFNDINEALDKVGDKIPAVRNELLTLKTIGNFSAAKMFDEFAKTDLDSIADDLKEIADEDGNITAAGIEKLKDSCSGLSELIDTGKYSLDGLANIINAVNHGASFSNVSDSIIEVLNNVKTTDSAIQDLYNRIDNWNAGRSLTEGTDFRVEQGKSFKELIENGIESGAQYENYFEQLSGQNYWEYRENFNGSYTDMLKDAYELANLPEKINKEQQKYIKNNNAEGWLETLGFTYENGELKDALSWDQIVEAMQSNYKTNYGTEIGEQFAMDMFLGITEYVDGATLGKIFQKTVTDALGETNWDVDENGIHTLSEEETQVLISVGILPDEEMTPKQLNKWIEEHYPDAKIKVETEIEEPEEPDKSTPTVGKTTPDRRGSVANRVKEKGEKPEKTTKTEKEKTYVPSQNTQNVVQGLKDVEKTSGQVTTSVDSDMTKMGQALANWGKRWQNTKTDIDSVQQSTSKTGSIATSAMQGMASTMTSASSAVSSVNSAAQSTAMSIGDLKQAEYGIGETAQEGAENATSAYEQLDTETQAAIARQQAIANAMNNAGSAAVKAAAKVSLLALAIRALKSKAITISVNIKASASIDTGGIASKIGSAISSALSILPPSIRSFLGLKTGTKLSRSNIVSAASTPSKFMTAASGVYGGLRKKQLALTGEIGPELAYDDEGAFLLGANGPEVAYLKKGTVIYDNKDTKKILGHNKFKGRINNYLKTDTAYRSDWSPTGSSGSTSKNTSKNKTSTPKANAKSATKAIKEGNEESEKWENSVDFIYNLLEQINKQARIREKLEKRYQRLLKDNKSSLKDIRDITRQQLANLQAQRASEEERIKKREEEMRDTLDKNKDLAEYLQYDFDTQTINIDWEKVDAITNKDTGEAFEKFKSEVERIRDDIWDAEDSIEDIDDAVDEINERGRDQRKELEERIINALKQQREQQIEEQENLNKTIEDANSKLIDSIDANISQMRKDREREKTRTDLEDKERRLAYMRQDTTGGNAVAIKQLEKELNDAKESYVDTLVDDRLQDIKDQNEEARTQREKQIELMKSRLEYDEKHGLLAEKANEMISEFIQKYGNKENFSVADTEIYNLLSDMEETEAMGIISKADWAKELKTALKEINQPGADVTPEDYMEYMRGEAKLEDKNLFRKYETERNKIVEDKTAFTSSYDEGMREKVDSTKDYMKDINAILAKDDKDLTRGDWENLFKLAGLRDQKIAGLDLDSLPYKIEEPDTFKYILRLFGKKYTLGAYATGGLVDSTGPAWLDGTKTRPEMVLNAQQTAAFIQLKDILSQLSLSDTPTSDNYNFDIDIHVDQISNDYDVDRMAEQLERSLYEKAMYRNVNSLRFMK